MNAISRPEVVDMEFWTKASERGVLAVVMAMRVDRHVRMENRIFVICV